MKKIYQTPVIKSIFVKNEAMLAGSIGIGESTSKLDGTVTADAPEFDFEDLAGTLDANGSLNFSWE